MSEKKYGDIPPLFELKDCRKMTVGELLEALGNYPPDSLVHIAEDGKPRSFSEIKDVTPAFHQDTGKASPILVLGKIS